MANRTDFINYFGHEVPWTIQAQVVREDDWPVMLAGVANEKLQKRAFVDFEEGLDINQHIFKRAIIEAMKWVKASRLPVYAVPEHDTGAKLLERLGFVRCEDIYLWPN